MIQYLDSKIVKVAETVGTVLNAATAAAMTGLAGVGCDVTGAAINCSQSAIMNTKIGVYFIGGVSFLQMLTTGLRWMFSVNRTVA